MAHSLLTAPLPMRSDVNKSPRKNWSTAVAFGALLLTFLVLTLKMIAPFLAAVFIGAILALLLLPAYRKLLRLRWNPNAAAALVTLSLTVLIIGPIGGYATIAAKQGISLAQAAVGDDDLSFPAMARALGKSRVVKAVFGDSAALQNQLRTATQGAAKAASGFLLGIVGSLPNYGLQAALTLISCFFFLVDGRRFIDWTFDKVPLDWDVRRRLSASFSDTAVSVIWSTLAAASAQATVMFVSFITLGVPGAFLAGGATFVFAWIPILGSTPVWLGGAIYLYSQGLYGKMAAMLALGAFTGIIDNFVRVLILKGRNEMHPLVSLVAIFGGISMFGIFGVFLGPVLAAVLIVLLQIWPVIGHRYAILKPNRKPPVTGTGGRVDRVS